MASSEENRKAAQPRLKEVLGAVGGVAVGVGFALLCPDVGLGEQGVRCLGILLGAIVWWVAGVLPEFATGFVMVVLFAVAGGVGTNVSLSGFSTGTWWLLVGAFGLGAGMKRSGLMERMARAVVRAFPNTFAAQAAGLVAASSVVGPLVPSLAAKVSMLEPVALEVGKALGYEKFGKQMQGLFLAVFTGVRSIGPLALSASIVGYALLATLPDDVKVQFDMLHWAIAALPWFVLATLANYAALVALYRPRGEGRRGAGGNSGAGLEAGLGAGSAASAAMKPGGDAGGASASADPGADSGADAGSVPVRSSGAGAQLPSPSPMTLHEKEMAAIALSAVTLWALQPLHGVEPHIVALAGFALTIACGILDKRSIRDAIAWDSLLFIGTALGLSAVFEQAGIQDWLVSVASPAFSAFAGNPLLFVLGIGLVTTVMRFVIVSEVAYVNIVMPFLVPLAVQAGISPWVVGFAMYVCISPWFVIYQNAVYLPALYSVDGEMVRHNDVAKYCIVYMAICFAALAASVPYWQWMGLM